MRTNAKEIARIPGQDDKCGQTECVERIGLSGQVQRTAEYHDEYRSPHDRWSRIGQQGIKNRKECDSKQEPSAREGSKAKQDKKESYENSNMQTADCQQVDRSGLDEGLGTVVFELLALSEQDSGCQTGPLVVEVTPEESTATGS